MPILGVIASGISGHLTPAFDAGAYDALGSVTLTATASTVSFGGIPAGYRYIEIRTSWFTTVAGSYMYEYYNGDTGNNYNRAAFYGAASSGGGGSYSSVNTSGAAAMDYADNTTFPSMRVSQYLDYTDTTKTKTVLSITGRCYSSTSGAVVQQATMWNSTAPITNISLVSDNPIAIGSTFSVYGVK